MTTLSTALVAAILTLVAASAYIASRKPKTHEGDALLLDLCAGLAGVTAATLWFAASYRIRVEGSLRPFFGSRESGVGSRKRLREPPFDRNGSTGFRITDGAQLREASSPRHQALVEGP